MLASMCACGAVEVQIRFNALSPIASLMLIVAVRSLACCYERCVF